MPVLVFTSGPLSGQRVPVDADMLLGREDAGVIVDDPEVSRHHAVLRHTGQGLQIEDVGSRNGTFVNDEQIKGTTTLHNGDLVRIGQTRFSVELDVAGATVISETPGATLIAARPPTTEAPPQPASVVVSAPPDPAPPPPSPTPTATAPPTPESPRPAATAPQFTVTAPPRRAPARVASRQAPAMMITFLIILATGIALALYFAMR